MKTFWTGLYMLGVVALLWAVSPAQAELRPNDQQRAMPPAQAELRSSDQRRAIANDNSRPARLVPHTRLAPLPPESEGTIRRVAVKGRKVVALTFDLCELAVTTTGYNAPLIDFLREKKLPATLFLGGKWMRTHSERTLELLADPLFEIGTHGWAHGNLGIMSESAIQRELDWSHAQYELLREELERRQGVLPHVQPLPPLFRLPYGRCSDAALRLLAQAGLRVIQWDVVGEPGRADAKAGAEKSVVAGVKPGSILLFHANLVPKGSLDILRGTVALLQAQGYSFVTVSQLLDMGTPQMTRDGYFNKPGDNHQYDTMFGVDGTGAKR